MKTEKVLESMFMIGYRKGIEEARRELAERAELDRIAEREFKRGRMAEAQSNGDKGRALDILGGAE